MKILKVPDVELLLAEVHEAEAEGDVDLARELQNGVYVQVLRAVANGQRNGHRLAAAALEMTGHERRSEHA